jgi:uncharacterized protein YicC (UPF0701 family)
MVPFLKYAESYKTVANVLRADTKERETWETLIKSTIDNCLPHLSTVKTAEGQPIDLVISKIVVLRIIERALK